MPRYDCVEIDGKLVAVPYDGGPEERCHDCGEPGAGKEYNGVHRECGLYMVAGGVKCQQGLCERLGGPGCDDDPNLTYRENAKIAFEFYSTTCICNVPSEFATPAQQRMYCPVHSGRW